MILYKQIIVILIYGSFFVCFFVLQSLLQMKPLGVSDQTNPISNRYYFLGKDVSA